MYLLFLNNNKIINETDGCYLQMQTINGKYCYAFNISVKNLFDIKNLKNEIIDDTLKNEILMLSSNYIVCKKIQFKPFLSSNNKLLKVIIGNLIRKLETKYEDLSFLILV